MAHFDWYAATVPAYPRVIADTLASQLPGVNGLTSGRGRHGYHNATCLVSHSGDTLATVLHGGSNPEPHVVASGSNAGPVSDILREHWPDDHRVSRLDSAEDLIGDFPTIMAKCLVVADTHRVKGLLMKPTDLDDGSTFYLGAPTSSVRMRHYEKTKQLRSQAADPDSVPDDLNRLEVQWRPIKEARYTAAKLTPGEVWGVAAFTRQIASEVLLRDPNRVQVRPRLLTTDERRDRALARQYGTHIRGIYRRAGSDAEALGTYILGLIGVGDDA